MRYDNKYRLCEMCSKRGCKRWPKFNTDLNRYVCAKKVPIKQGFKFYEIVNDSSPMATGLLLAKFNLSVKNGYTI